MRRSREIGDEVSVLLCNAEVEDRDMVIKGGYKVYIIIFLTLLLADLHIVDILLPCAGWWGEFNILLWDTCDLVISAGRPRLRGGFNERDLFA